MNRYRRIAAERDQQAAVAHDENSETAAAALPLPGEKAQPQASDAE
jgi:hypothetical protein